MAKFKWMARLAWEVILEPRLTRKDVLCILVQSVTISAAVTFVFVIYPVIESGNWNNRTSGILVEMLIVLPAFTFIGVVAGLITHIAIDLMKKR